MAVETTGPYQYYTGRQLIHARLTPLIVGSNGLFIRDTSDDLALSDTIESITFDSDVEDVNIKSANMTMANYVNVSDDYQVTVSEIINQYGDALVLNSWVGIDFFLAEAVFSGDGGVTVSHTVQAVCKRRSLRAGYAEGKATMELVGVPCGLPMIFIAQGAALAY